MARTLQKSPRLLIVPGLHDSGPDHWQTWLQARHPHSRRVQQADWAVADLDAWASRIGDTLADEPEGPWIAVAHSYGCLALLRRIQTHGAAPFAGALLVAPAEPRRFGADDVLLRRSPLREAILVASRNDPWMSLKAARAWAQCWDIAVLDAGELGHINPEAGLGPWPLAASLVEQHIQRWNAEQRFLRAHPLEFTYAL